MTLQLESTEGHWAGIQSADDLATGVSFELEFCIEGHLLRLTAESTSSLPVGSQVFVRRTDGWLVFSAVDPAGDATDAGGAACASAVVPLCKEARELSIDLDAFLRLPNEAVARRIRQTFGVLPKGFRIASDHDFSRLVQNPATRLTDETQLLHIAIHCLRVFPLNFWILSGGVCVIAYRILGGKVQDEQVHRIFSDHCQRALYQESNVPFGIEMRWRISVRLAAAYVALRHGDHELARQHLAEILKYAPSLPEWPSSLTNISLAGYGLGYLELLSNNKRAAARYFQDTVSLFKFGAASAQFPNTYSFGEIGNALKVAEEAFIAFSVCTRGGPLMDPNLAPMGTEIQPKRIPAPLGWLLPPLH